MSLHVRRRGVAQDVQAQLQGPLPGPKLEYVRVGSSPDRAPLHQPAACDLLVVEQEGCGMYGRGGREVRACWV